MTDPPPALGSPRRAAGMPPISTVADPMTIASAPQLSPRRAAGIPTISTVGAPGGMIGVGIPCVVVLTIMSVTRAARDIVPPGSVDLHHSALDYGHGATIDLCLRATQLRRTRARGLESALRAELRVRS